MLSRQVRRQLVIFALVSFLALGALGIKYLQIPDSLGIGRYQVSVPLAHASGLYPNAPVTFRGVQVGKVTSVDLTADGTLARLNLSNDVDIPASVSVAVRNGSVIGEPFLDLLAPPHATDTAYLKDGDTIAADRVALPVATGRFLTGIRDLVESLPSADLATVLTQSATALRDPSALPELIDSSTNLLRTATAPRHQRATMTLIENSQRVLDSQRKLRDQIRTSVLGLEDVTGALASADAGLRQVLTAGAPTARRAVDLIRGISDSLPRLVRSGAQLAEVLNVYIPALKHLLIVFPGLLEANGSAQQYDAEADYGEAGLSFKLTVNNPPVCYEGFPEAFQMRNPSDLRPMPLPEDSYCKVAHSDPRVVRGARNMPCPNDPDRRGARAEACGLIFNKAELK